MLKQNIDENLLAGVEADFVDSRAPTVTLTAAPAGATHLYVAWSASDASPSSGISSYDVQYKVGSGAWTDWLTGTTETSALFRATLTQTYTFQARVRDLAGNVSGWVQTGVVEVSPVTKYYLFGGQWTCPQLAWDCHAPGQPGILPARGSFGVHFFNN